MDERASRCCIGSAFAFRDPKSVSFTAGETWNFRRQKWIPPDVQSPYVDGSGVAFDTSRGVVNAMAQRLVNGRTLDFTLRARPMHLYEVRYTHFVPSSSPLATFFP